MANKKINRMVGIALLMATVVVLQYISSIIPSVSGFNISLVLIPIVLGAAVYGPMAGAVLGATFGVIVFINSATGADASGQMVFQANPILCFVAVMGKGILAGWVSGLTYKLLEKNSYVAMLCAAIVCPVVNTGVFIAFMLLFFMDILSVWAGTDILGFILTGLILANFLPELLINVIFSPAGHRIKHIVTK